MPFVSRPTSGLTSSSPPKLNRVAPLLPSCLALRCAFFRSMTLPAPSGLPTSGVMLGWDRGEPGRGSSSSTSLARAEGRGLALLMNMVEGMKDEVADCFREVGWQFDTGRNQIWHRSRFITAVAWSGTTYMDMQCNGSAT